MDNPENQSDRLDRSAMPATARGAHRGGTILRAAALVGAGPGMGWLLFHPPPTFALYAPPDSTIRRFQLCGYFAAGLLSLVAALRTGNQLVLAWFVAVGVLSNNAPSPLTSALMVAAGAGCAFLFLRPTPAARTNDAQR